MVDIVCASCKRNRDFRKKLHASLGETVGGALLAGAKPYSQIRLQTAKSGEEKLDFGSSKER